MREQRPNGLRWMVGLCGLLMGWPMACGGEQAECKDGIQVSEYNTSGLKCTKPCDCSNLKFEGYCISGTCVSNPRNPAQRKGEIRSCKLLQKVGTCAWGQQEAQPAPLTELVWGDCKAEQVGPNFPEDTKERCLDGVDNDCDGLTDLDDSKCNAYCVPKQTTACYTADPKTLHVGPCRPGLKTCKEDNTWGPCVGEKVPGKEFCNNQDDDCNGLIDDGLDGCTAQSCQNDEQRGCYPEVVGCVLETIAQDIVRFRCQGACIAGIQTCRNGSWGACEKKVGPTAEICDGIDNNCDGAVDEGCLCEAGKQQACSLGPQNKAVGECVLGKQTCVGGKWGACEGAKAPSIEYCNKQDDDCDGQIDNHCVCTQDKDCEQGLLCLLGSCRKRICPSGQSDCGETCADLNSSSAHCGACNNACTEGRECVKGACQCPKGGMFCEGACVDAQTSAAHCGACGKACASPRTCEQGICVCPAAQSFCGEGCIATNTSNQHCGACNNACLGPKTCVGGKCTCPSGQDDCGSGCIELIENTHCGACNNACQNGQTCQNRQCTCPSGKTACGGVCIDTQTSAAHCGACGKACGVGLVCKAGQCEQPLLLAAGSRYACAVTDCNALTCWGANDKGQLGIAVSCLACPPTPVALPSGLRLIQVAAGDAFTCALFSDGSVRCWGENSSGQLGYGDTTNHATPKANAINLGAGRSAKSIATGSSHTCAILDDDSVKCWGNNQRGQLGEGNTSQRNAPPATAINLGAGRSAKSITAGFRHTCAILDDNSVKCWGANDFGALGYGDTTQRNAPDTNVINLGTGRSAKSIAVGYSHTCAILDDNSVKCWGYNIDGRLGYGDTTDRKAPDTTVINLGTGRSAKSIHAGSWHTCVLLDDNSVKCWGANSFGQLGYGDTTNRKAPDANAVNLGAGRTAKAIVAGGAFICAHLDDGTLRCWGDNDMAQVEYTTRVYATQPSTLPLVLGQIRCGGTCADAFVTSRCGACQTACQINQICANGRCVWRYQQVAAGSSHTCTLFSDGSARCWGGNSSGQLGYGDTTNRATPDTKAIILGTGRSAKSITTGFHTCALLDNNSVKCWGDNNNGQLGYGDTTDRNAPDANAINLGTGRSAKSTAVGINHTCALLDNSSVKCWGANSFGQLGYGDITDRNAPDTNAVNLGVGRSAKSVAAGSQHSCAILDNDTIKCWGANSFGQLGYGDATNRNAPDANVINLGAGRSAKSIAAGAYHSCAVLDNNTVKCWGYNNNGRLGYGDTTNRNAPDANAISLGAGRSAKSIFVGTAHTCAILDDSSVKCWGDNTKGQLGYGDTTNRNAPGVNAINLGTGRSAKSLTAGSSHTCAILDDDSVKCWGGGDSSQLGYGDKTSRNAPSIDALRYP